MSIKTEGEDRTLDITREGADGSDELDEATIAAITLTELTNSCKTDLRRERSLLEVREASGAWFPDEQEQINAVTRSFLVRDYQLQQVHSVRPLLAALPSCL